MALIKCPECGKEISDRAQACIHCGCPIAIKSSTTSIKMPSTIRDFGPGKMSSRAKISIWDSANKTLIKEAVEDENVSISIETPYSIDVVVKAGIFSWTGTYTIYPNKRYQLSMVRNFMGGWKPKTTPILNEVDMIDSE